MEAIHRQGIWAAETLQGWLGGLQGAVLFLSWLGDPKTSFLVCFPVAYALNKRVGVCVLWTAILTEWLNLTCKWLMFGERPFWWIHESGVYIEPHLPRTQQFFSTCETGPGSPSGHAMVTAGTWWVMMTSFSNFLRSRTGSWLTSSIPILLYLTLLLGIGISRIFILAHFPHQVLAGTVTGAALSFLLTKRVPENKSFLYYAATSGGLLLTALGLHGLLQYLGMDLSWSIVLATKWCARPDWIRLDTAPFTSLSRDAGAALGLGLGSSLLSSAQEERQSWGVKAASSALALFLLRVLDQVPGPTHSKLLFYAVSYLKNALGPFTVMAVIPWLMRSLAGNQATKKKQ
ncbi:glucose-6-phosphatase 3 [Callorhinchus milii]|uniref:glucose-6-phosphatase 3 n=1 Tax=Callorhinchus milii TaxID=7868 RepID=UPI001C3FD476|nr:glucose-6-phosphatase 3 [Callorhinchus milii]